MTTTIRKRRARRRQAALASDPFVEVSESVALLEQATEANQKQIEATQNAIQDLASSTNQQIKDVLSVVKEQGATTGAKIEALSIQMTVSQKPNYALWISVIVLVTILVGAAYKIADLQTMVTMSPIMAKTERSEQDRTDMRRDIDQNSSQISEERLQRNIIHTKLMEIETQFRASDQSRNVQFAEQQRMNNIIFQLINSGAKGVNYPLNPYFFPSISTPPNGNNGSTPK